MKNFLILLPILFLTSCVMTKAEGQQLRADLDRLRYEVANLQKTQDDLEHEVSQDLEKLTGKASKLESSLDLKQKLDAESTEQSARMMQEIRELKGLLEESQHEVGSLKESQQKLREEQVKRLAELQAQKAKLSELPESRGALYDKAKELYANKNYAKAILVFDVFLDKFGKARGTKDLLDYAYYYKGDSYYKMAMADKKISKRKDLLKKAIVSYQKILTAFPKSRKHDEALYRIGQSMELLGFTSDALVFYEEMIKTHPKSSLVARTQNKIHRIKSRLNKNKTENRASNSQPSKE